MSPLDILRDPIWQGIASIITILQCLVYLWKERARFVSPAKFIGRTVFLLLSGLIGASPFFAIALMCGLLTESPFRPSITRSIIGMAQLVFLLGAMPGLAAMTTRSKDSSAKLAVGVAFLNALAFILYLQFRYPFVGLWITTVNSPTAIRIVMELLADISYSFVMAILVGLPAWAGVVFGRAFLDSRGRVSKGKP